MHSRPARGTSSFLFIFNGQNIKKTYLYAPPPIEKRNGPLNGLNMKTIKTSALIGLLAAVCAPAGARISESTKRSISKTPDPQKQGRPKRSGPASLNQPTIP